LEGGEEECIRGAILVFSMDHRSNDANKRRLSPLEITSTILLLVVAYQAFKMHSLETRVNTLSSELASTTESYRTTMDILSQGFSSLSRETLGLSTTITSTKEHVEAVSSQVAGVQETVGSISGTVNTLQKLSTVDAEILKKYSKIFFLSENYVPAHLSIIPPTYTYSSSRTEKIVSEVWPFLEKLLIQANNDGVALYVKSGYRSFAEQKSLKSTYSVIYGAGTANTFSADQGYSEHQLGTTVDFITSGLGGNLGGFDSTKAYEWLEANAYRYGFVLSYPKDNAYYIYEPWHWRFVGIRLATYLHNNNQHFYDLDQRTIDTYLANTYDY
jgi:LAS superfamily LD-carboxypeptidase LdcB